MRRSALAGYSTQSARRQRRQSFWEEENVPEHAYADEEEWQEEWTDEDQPSAFADEDELAEDASRYAAFDNDDFSFFVQEEGEADDSPDDEAFDFSEEQVLVAFRGRQADYTIRQGGARNSLVALPYELEPETLAPVFIAGNRKKAKVGALGHSPLALRAHRPRPFLLHTLVLAVVLVSLVVSMLTVGALSTGPQFWNSFTSLAGFVAPPPPPLTFHWYTVRFADTVESIAAQFKVQPGGILELNRLIDGEQIYTGMSLKIPADPTYGANVHALLNLPYAPAITPPPPYSSDVTPPGFPSFAVQDYPGDPWAGSFGQCTWWAAHKRPDENFLGIGDARYWADGARTRGYIVTTTPAPHATAVFEPGVQGAQAAGHAAHVEQMLPGGWILISEMNFSWNGGGWGRVDYRYITAGPGIYFIH